jgi:hypothetical protein
MPTRNSLNRSALQLRRHSVQTMIRSGNANRNILPAETITHRIQPLDRNAKAPLRSRLKTEPKLVKPLIPAVDGISQSVQNRPRRQLCVALSRVHQVESSSTLNSRTQRGYPLLNAMLCRRNQLSSSRRRRRAKIRDEIGNRKVRLMANGADNRKYRRGDSTRQPLIVEACEVFHRTAASGNHNEIDQRRIVIEPANPCTDRLRTGTALHRSGIHQQIQPRMTTANHSNDIADHCAGE